MLALAKLGQAYLTGDSSSAIDALTRAQSTVNKPSVTEPVLNAKIYTLLAKSYVGHGDYKQADDSVSTGLPFFDALLSQNASPPLDPTQVKPVAKAAAQLPYAGGYCRHAAQQLHRCHRAFHACARLCSKAGEKGGLMDADALAAIADADVDLQKWPDAITNDDQAIEIYIQLGNTRGEKPSPTALQADV